MSKHPANVLVFFGIAVCAAFLIAVPAGADSGQGFTALESGEFLSFSPASLPAAENATEPSGVSPPQNGENASDEEELSDAASTGIEVSGTETESLTSAGSENDSPAVAHPGGTGSPGDERLIKLINANSIRLMRLSMEHAHALYRGDTDAASSAADDLHAFSTRLLGEVQPLQVPLEQQPIKDEFVRSLSAYSTASESLLDPMDADEDPVPTALNDLDTASKGLETVSQQAVEMQPASTGAGVLTREAPAVPDKTDPVVVAPTPVRLPLMERFTYDDPSGENMVSLLVESTRTATAYEEVPNNESTAEVEAGDGRKFLLVVVKSTNLGHRGDSDLYAIETPGREAFVLECQGTAYEPLEVPSFTSLGESFDRKTLERYESLKGYLYFDVPAALDTSEAILRVDLGYAGTPAWDIGRELGKEPDGPAAP
ncbi:MULTISPECIES: hypothetical protein [unclassified Methanoculleus]|jgi:hypothetical protein|uniref:hypothetical protein n=1 Tax=unclassified Methanoculleus TaxID=2619537 RepID=UPI00319EA78D